MFIVVTALSCFAQSVDIQKYDFGKPISNADLPIHVGELPQLATAMVLGKIDTIRSYLLVTMDIPECSGSCRITTCITGYEVLEIKDYEFKCFYLDEDKTPISKNIIVWMSKPIEK